MESSMFAVAAIFVAAVMIGTASAAIAPSPAPASDASTYVPAVAVGIFGSLAAFLFGSLLC